ncbi:hypothetical protein MCFN_00415 [Mycoplasmopsis californica]|uniref:Uncharacterized protein n=2 Tax=Mycoplasmopsis californica TaxID=2113 RepID=A0A059XVL9_9BACT|nr:hypothetical protein [Mycoplasmopsis californica]AIA29257.1 hypothetical protein MCFN_00415 [Mycoplasmopsis californica]
MKTMLDIVSEIALKECDNGVYVEFNTLFEGVEAELKSKWFNEAEEKEVEYEKIRINKLGELYRLLTVDSNFVRNQQGKWSIRPGFGK